MQQVNFEYSKTTEGQPMTTIIWTLFRGIIFHYKYKPSSVLKSMAGVQKFKFFYVTLRV